MSSRPHAPFRLAALIGAATLAAPAYAGEGPYVGLGFGANSPRDQELRTGEVEFDDGGLGALTLGAALRSGWRPELEMAVRQNDGDSAAPGPQGEADTDAMMANLWYDFGGLGFAPKLRPYIGAGGGRAEVAFDRVVDSGGVARSGESDVMAYQAGAGLGYDMTPRLTLGVDYRYLQTERETFAPGAGLSRYQSDSVMAGLRYSFGSPRAVPVAVAPAPEPEVAVVPPVAEVAAFEVVTLRPVNFQFNQADLTPPAKETLDQLLGQVRGRDGLRIVVQGHTDALGPDEYNTELGLKRATAVRDYLVSNGIPGDAVRVASMGESEPVASNDTEEGRTLNRRTEVRPDEAPANVKITVEEPTPESVEAAR